MTSQERQRAIAQRWQNTKNAQKAQLDSQYIASESQLKNQLGKTSQYDELKKQAHVNHAMQERARKEQMANMGLSGAGGTSQTLQQRSTSNLNNNIGNIKRQQQDFTDNVNLALANLKTQYEGNLGSMMAQSDAQKNAELLADDQWWKGFNSQEEQFAKQFNLQKSQAEQAQTQFEKQFGLEKQNNWLQNLIALRNKRGITRSQFRDKANWYMNNYS